MYIYGSAKKADTKRQENLRGRAEFRRIKFSSITAIRKQTVAG